MAIRKLGISGSEITLPSIAVTIPTAVEKNIGRAEMSSGSTRWGFLKKHKEWEITFRKLTKAELDDLIALRSYNQILKWQNNDESADWYDVVITSFDYDTEDPKSPTTFWFASMTLEEAV